MALPCAKYSKITRHRLIKKIPLKRSFTMSLYQRIKKRTHEIIGPTERGDIPSLVYDIAICLLVVLSSAAVILELVGIGEPYASWLSTFELVTVGIFITEYAVRVWVAEIEYPECESKLAAIWEYITSFDSLIDLISILSILFNSIPKELAFLRLIKLIKLVRLVKVTEHIKLSGGISERVKQLQVRVNEILDKGKEGDIASKVYDITSVILIIVSVSSIVVETFPIGELAHSIIYVIEIIIAVFFSVEYVLRVWTAPLDNPDVRPDKARMMYIFSFMSFVDLLSIVPVFVADLPTATGILKIFKLCKIVRLLKASRYLSGIASFGKAIQKKKKQILMSLIAITAVVLISSVLMYSFENKEQPEVFTNGFSGIWYSIQMLTDADTEMAPVTPIGQMLSTLMLLLGGCMFGVPLAIIGTGFEDMIGEQAGEEKEEEIYNVLRMYDSLSDEDKLRLREIIMLDIPKVKARLTEGEQSESAANEESSL